MFLSRYMKGKPFFHQKGKKERKGNLFCQNVIQKSKTLDLRAERSCINL